MTVLLQQVIKRPRLVAPLAFATAAVVAAVIAVLVISPFDRGGRAPEQVTQLPDEAFGVLPESRPDGKGGGGVTIPGSSGAIAYSLSPNLSLPESAAAYRLTRVTPERVREIADRLRFTEAAEPLFQIDGTVAGYRVASAPACPAGLPPPPPGIPKEDYEAKACSEPIRVFQMMLDGSIFYSDSTVAATASALSEEQAIAAARDWLLLTGLADSDTVVRSLEPGDPMCSPGCWQAVADFVPQLPYLPGPGARPRISIIVNGPGIVTHVAGSWGPTDAQSIYPLHTAAELLINLKNLRGEFDFLFAAPVGGKDQAPPLPPMPPDTFRDASATVESVEVVYARGVAADGQAYLAPVYIVRVNLTQPGLAEPFPFATWVPATGPAASPPEVPQPLAELIAVRDALPLPTGAEQMGDAGWEADALITSYFAPDAPEVVTQVYRRELPGLGWQVEEPPIITSGIAMLLPGPSGNGGPSRTVTVITFIKDDMRVGLVLAANEKDASRGETILSIVVERR